MLSSSVLVSCPGCLELKSLLPLLTSFIEKQALLMLSRSRFKAGNQPDKPRLNAAIIYRRILNAKIVNPGYLPEVSAEELIGKIKMF